MYSERLETLIDTALADGEIDEKKMYAIEDVAREEGIGYNEIHTYVNGKLYKMKQEHKEKVEAAEKENSIGNLKTCPSCHKPVLYGSATCPHCGYAFNEDVTTDSSTKLGEMLAKLETDYIDKHSGVFSSFTYNPTALRQAKMNLISNFSVPNTRPDLLNFLTMLQPKANKNGSRRGGTAAEDLSRAYWDLYSNCIMKAKVSFKNDEDFQYFFQHYDKQKHSFFNFDWLNVKTGIIIYIVISIIFSLILNICS